VRLIAPDDVGWPPLLGGLKRRLASSPSGYRLAKGAFWSLAGSLISRGLGLISGIMVARIIGKAEFGELAMIQSTVGMFGVLAGFSLGLTATKHVAEFKTADPTRAGRIIALSSLVAWGSGGIASVILYLLSPWLATHTLAAPGLSNLLRIGCLLLLLGAVNGAQTGALAGFEAFKTIARVGLIAGVWSFPITLACVISAGLKGAVWAQIIALTISGWLNYLSLRREATRARVPLGYGHCFKEWRVLWTFSLPSALGGTLAGPVGWAASALLVNQVNGYSEMGIYGAAQRMKAIPESVLTMLMAPLLPILSEQFSRHEIVAYHKTLRYAFTLSLSIVIPVSLVQIAAPWLTLLPFGAEYRTHSDSIVRWLMVHACFLGVFFPFSSILPSMNRAWCGFAYNVGYSALTLTSALVLIPRFGGAGLAGAFTVSYIVASLICLAYLNQQARLLVSEMRLLPVISSVALGIVACVWISQFLGHVSGILGAVATVALFTLYHSYRAWLRH
jgi:O-antigen/teichoic acid export membrane protein